MELYIRSQDKKKLHKINKLELDNDETGIFDLETYDLLGKYKTKERALEILDDIQDRMKNILILSIKTSMTCKDQHRLLDSYKQEFNKDFILETPTAEIKPVNSETVLYEMPKE